MHRKRLVVLAMALLAPVVVRAQQSGPWPDDCVPRRLPATAVRQNEIPPSLSNAVPQLVQPVQYVELVSDPPPETLPPGLPATAPDDAHALTLADLETMALTNNPSIARAAALAQAARGNHIQVGLPPNPSVGFEAQQIGSRGLAEQDGVFISQEIVRGGKLRLNREVTAQEWIRFEQQLAAQQQRVLTDVRVAYYQMLVAQRQLTLADELGQIARESLTVAENLWKGKEVGRVDVVQAQLEAENADIIAQSALNRRTAAWQSIAAVVGNPRLPLQPLHGDLEESRDAFEWEETLERLVTSSPEIAAAMSNVERARWAVQLACAERTPNVTVQGLVNWRDNGIGGSSDGAITVGVPLPLWNRNQGRIIQAHNEVTAAERALDQLELELQKRLAGVFERYANALNQVTKYRAKILPAAQESYALTQRLYRGGETAYLNLLTAQRTYSQTNLNYLESLQALRTTEAEIEGLLLSGSLENR